MILLSSPGGAAIVCPVCGSELALPHACTRFPSPPAAPPPDSEQRSDVTAAPSAGSFRYPNPMWGDTRPGASS